MVSRSAARWLLTGGAIGPILFFVVALVLGWTRPGYDPMVMYVSYLGLSDGGWVLIAATVAGAALLAASALGLRWAMRSGRGSRSGPILIGVGGVSLVVAGILVPVPARGYPPGTPPGPPPHPSFVALAHDWAAGVAVLAVMLAMVVMGWRFVGERDGGRWATYSLLSALGLVLMLLIGFVPSSVSGLLERLGVLVGVAWVTLVMWRFRRESAA